MSYSRKTLQILMNLIAKTASEQPKLGRKLSAAYDLVLQGKVRLCPLQEGDALVLSSSEKGVEYRIGPGRCSCADFLKRGGPCKHRLSFRLWLVAQAEESSQQAAQRTKQARTSHGFDMERYIQEGGYAAELSARETKRLSDQLEDHCRTQERRNLRSKAN